MRKQKYNQFEDEENPQYVEEFKELEVPEI